MARYPSATWRPLPENKTQPGIAPRTVIVHSAVTRGGADSLYPYFARKDVNLESHLYVTRAGRVEQYIDTARRADANNKANAFAVSIETEDLGDPDNQPWTDPQLQSLEDLIRWICATHAIPLRRCPSWAAGGIGYHTMWGAPSPWTPVKKTCPGRVRIAQFNDQLMPALTRSPTPEDDDMPSPSQESLAHASLVECWYNDIALAAPDPAGFCYWVGLLEDGQDPVKVRKAFAGAVAAKP